MTKAALIKKPELIFTAVLLAACIFATCNSRYYWKVQHLQPDEVMEAAVGVTPLIRVPEPSDIEASGATQPAPAISEQRAASLVSARSAIISPGSALPGKNQKAFNGNLPVHDQNINCIHVQFKATPATSPVKNSERITDSMALKRKELSKPSLTTEGLAGPEKKEAGQAVFSVINVIPSKMPMDFAEVVLLGDARTKLHDYTGAVLEYTAALAIAPDSGRLYSKRAKIKFQLRDYPGALDDYSMAISLNPADQRAYKGRSMAKLRMNDLTGALTDYNKIFNAGNIGSPKERGAKNLQAEDYKTAVHSYSDAIVANPLDKDAYRRRAEARFHLRDYKKALRDLTRAIRIDPQFAEAYLNRGVVRAILQDQDDAFIDFDYAESLGENNAGICIGKYCN